MNRLIVVSNRLPFALDSTGEDLWTVTPAVGGLVSAIEPVLRERGGTWIGWPGIAGEIPEEPFAQATRNAGYKIVPVALSETERDEFYYGYSNEMIWPLFWKHRGGFFAARCVTVAGRPNDWTVEQSNVKL